MRLTSSVVSYIIIVINVIIIRSINNIIMSHNKIVVSVFLYRPIQNKTWVENQI